MIDLLCLKLKMPNINVDYNINYGFIYIESLIITYLSHIIITLIFYFFNIQANQQ